ncbi:hypothetical protein [Halalkalibacter okhensis]|uniref:Uncharacterized protein n=1 Tax=Halalkalibacter okhensis TaxID=333138 RepID=A0A0B0IC72_9BACI|nr:hypothetical protein [Halalkalibacter okhensis]KHF38462.1 hypothetical protein LQ50_21275 [Halalkalibacter okhensis]
MQTVVNNKTQINTGNNVSITKGIIGFIVVSSLFFIGMISFASAQQKSTLEANMIEAINPSSSDLTFEYVGTEANPQLRKFYLAQADGEEFIVRVYQNNKTVLDAFSLTEHPELAQKFQETYEVKW